ncbi:hypothetical protein LTR09_009785 [Extremus antarcticus]|uniref:Uncharacterized protein n=1 Tax=Extremus antarcticus TaxID=702011 RepID=A0AAJ0D8B7_9PEZI|nr:hypothetical protein LTR09_009785 [Extremus antarcticus]
MPMLRVEVSDYDLTSTIVTTFLRETFPGYSDHHFNVEHVNGLYKFNIPSNVSEQRTKNELLKRRTSDDPYAPR